MQIHKAKSAGVTKGEFDPVLPAFKAQRDKAQRDKAQQQALMGVFHSMSPAELAKLWGQLPEGDKRRDMIMEAWEEQQ